MPDQRPASSARDYDAAANALRLRLDAPGGSSSGASRERVGPMWALIDVLWERFGGSGPGQGFSWVGFYLPTQDERGAVRHMVLGPSRDKPACSPIGLHGACGRAFLSGRALVVPDVAGLGEGYIECDARDRSELVVPAFDAQGSCWGVLDVDSHDVGAFTEADAWALIRLLRDAGLTTDREIQIQVIE